MNKNSPYNRARKRDIKPGLLKVQKRIIWENLNKKQKIKIKKRVKSGKLDPLLIQR